MLMFNYKIETDLLPAYLKNLLVKNKEVRSYQNRLAGNYHRVRKMIEDL